MPMSRSEAGKLGNLASRETQQKQKEDRRKIYLKNPKRCLNCNEILSYEKKRQKFCNQKCNGRFLGHTNRQSRIERPKCLNCGKETNLARNKYCSVTCQKEYINKLNHEQIIRSGNLHPTLKSNNSKRKYLKKVRGIKCEICGITEWMDRPVPLVMDHINGNPDDWRLNNLRLICGNCDMQTPTYKSKNKGNGRFWRRQRYKEGKSY